ncbi:MAG: AzlC family ABC transporter permease [Nocardioides sp.]
MSSTATGMFRRCFLVSLPMAMGYRPIGIALGVLFVKAGFPWYVAPISALAIFAGSMEFLLVGLIIHQAGLLSVFVATLLVNARHIFYPLSYPRHLRLRGLGRAYGSFTLTDEAYAVLNSGFRPESRRELLLVQALGHSYWVTGALLGGLFGGFVPAAFHGFDAAMAVLFCVLGVAFFRQNLGVLGNGQLLIAAAAGTIGVLAGLVVRAQFLIVALTVAICVAAAGVLIRDRRRQVNVLA